MQNNSFIKDKKIFINFNENAWSTNDIMLDWIDKVYKPYIFKDPLLGSSLLIIDKASSHICDEVIESCTENYMNISILPAGTTSVLQPLDISINKIFKTFIKEKYIKYCIDNNVLFSKVQKDDIINWVGQTWYDDNIITKDIIFKSFKVCGLSNKTNGSEDNLIKISEFLKNKVNEIDDQEEEKKDDTKNNIENEQIKIKEKIFNEDNED